MLMANNSQQYHAGCVICTQVLMLAEEPKGIRFSMQLELQAVVSHSVWVLQKEPGFSERIASALNY